MAKLTSSLSGTAAGVGTAAGTVAGTAGTAAGTVAGTAGTVAGTAGTAAGSTAAGGLAGLAGPIGLGTQIFGVGLSIAQFIDARKKARDSERAGTELLEQAKTRLDVNRMEGVQVPLEAYQMAARETTSQTKQAIEGLREADARTLASGIAKVTEAAGAVSEGQRQGMEQALYQRDVDIATEQADIDRMMGGISLEEAAGTELRRAEKEEDAQKSLQSAVIGAGQALQTAAEIPQLYAQRQGQLAAARQYQQQGGMYQNMNARQARRAMLGSGITPQQFQNIQKYGSIAALPFSVSPSYLPGIMGNIPYISTNP